MVKTGSGSQGAVHEQDPESTANRESQASTLKRKANANAYADDAKKSAQASRKNENRSSSSAKTRKAFSKSSQRGGSNASSDWLSGFEPPSWWPEALDKISEMRKDGNIASNAAVDSLGAEAAKHSLPNESELSEKQQRLIVLASAMLSSQTQDAVTHACVARLRATLPGGLCPEGLLAVSQQYLGRELIKPVGFWSRKASYLQRTAQMLIDKHDGDIPPTLDQLLELPGVGPKMAHLVMNVAWRDPNGVCVDVHVHRICWRLGFVPDNVRDPEHTREALETWLPKEWYASFNPLLVGFGQTVCKSSSPSCSQCSLNHLCPSAQVDF